ncbi:hypothetical protein LTR80_005530 [Exophiala xenobiotica]
MASDSTSQQRASDKIAEALVAEEHVEKVNIHGGKIPDIGGSFGDAAERSRRERALLRKQDLIIMPLMALSYMFSYLDRAQIGNARIMGLQKYLKLDNSQYYNCLMIYFVGFALAELPCALLLRKISANYVYGSSVILFGIVTTLVFVSGSYAGLMVLRFLLGIGEAVITTGFLYLNLWYRRDELAWRSGLFFASSAVAGLFSGLVAWAVAKDLEGVDGRHSWQWLFLVEGIPTIAVGILVCLLLPGLPDQLVKKPLLTFRNREERELILRRMIESNNDADVKIDFRQIVVALKDMKTLFGALLMGGVCLANTAFVIFMPTFIKEIGYSALDTQLYTMIPYAFAIVATLMGCYLSDRFDRRCIPILICLGSCILGLILLLTTTNKVALIAGCCFVASGSTPAVSIAAAWVNSIHAGYTKKATVFTINMFFVEGYAIIATQIYDTPPRFLKGHGVTLGLVGLATIGTVLLYFHLQHENKKRDAVARQLVERGEIHPLASKSLEEVYDFHPAFRYCL